MEYYKATCISILVFKSRSRHFRWRLRIRRVGQEHTTERLLSERSVWRRDPVWAWRPSECNHDSANAFLSVSWGFSIFDFSDRMR